MIDACGGLGVGGVWGASGAGWSESELAGEGLVGMARGAGDGGFCFEGELLLVVGVFGGGEGDGDAERVARCDEGAEFEGGGFGEDEAVGVGEGEFVGEGAARLEGGFDHEHARHDGEGGEVVLEVFLGGGEGLDGGEGGLWCVEVFGDDLVDELVLHRRLRVCGDQGGWVCVGGGWGVGG